MKRLLTVSLMLLAPLYCMAADNYGAYTNGKMTIEYDMGGRGEDLFRSSRCKGTFKPKYDGQAGMWSGKADKSFVIFIQGDPAHMEIEGKSKCFPEGRYRKVETK